MKNFILTLITLISISKNLNAQDDCYTTWEKELFDLINKYRKEQNLNPLNYSESLTQAAHFPIGAKPDYRTARETVGYNGSSAHMPYSFSFDHTTPEDALATLLSIPQNVQFLQDKYQYATYLVMGIARIENRACVTLGNKNDDTHTMILCEELKDEKGYEWIFKPKSEFWDMAYFHVGNLVPVRGAAHWGACNMKGEIVVPQKYWTLYSTRDSNFIITNEDSNKEYIIDSTGKILEEVSDDGIMDLGEVKVIYQGNTNYLQDKNGNILSAKYPDIYSIGRKLLAFQKGGVYGIMDYKGKILLQPKYGEIFAFSEDLACVKVGSKWGFIDTNFTMVIQPITSEKLDFYFNNGLVTIEQNGKYGYMDKKGKVVIPAKYSYVTEFGENGWASVAIGNNYGYINKAGEITVNLEYTQTKHFSYGYGAVKKDTKYAIIDDKGNILTDFEFDEVIQQENDIIKVRHDGRWGMIKIKK